MECEKFGILCRVVEPETWPGSSVRRGQKVLTQGRKQFLLG